MSPHFRETFDAVAEWPLWRTCAAADLADELDRAQAEARKKAAP